MTQLPQPFTDNLGGWVGGGDPKIPRPTLVRTPLVLALAALALAALAPLAAGCRGSGAAPGYTVLTGGNPQKGRDIILARHCGACHTISAVTGAHGVVGPPLDGFAHRSYIAGELPNTPHNVIRWIQNPHAVEPRTAMPTIGLGESEARDVAAYLYTLR